jgi:disulfide bond formation protein DsbB
MNEPLLQFFSFGAILLLAGCAIFLALEIFKIKNPFKAILLKAQNETIFFFSLFASACSLFLSLYFQFLPCELCWYQRVFLFTIPFISFVATVRGDLNARLYTFVLSSVGLGIALYHTLLQANIIKNVPVFCNPASAGDCAVPDFMYFGFVTIPVISCAVFLTLLICSYVYKK